MLAVALVALAGLVACERPRDVAVRVSIPGPDSVETPVTGVGLIALPYDRDSVLAALEAAASLAPSRHDGAGQPVPRLPRARSCATPPPSSGPSACATRSTGCATRLDSIPRDTPEYRELYAAFSRLNDSLTAAQSADRAGPRGARPGPRRFHRPQRAACARRSGIGKIAPTEGTTVITRNLAARRRQDPRTDTTGGDGWARFTLPAGEWWIYGRSWDATDPNAEWYWNLPVTDDTILLSSRTGRQRRRY